MAPYTITLQDQRIVRSPTGKWVGCATVMTARGPIQLCATLEESTLRAALQSSFAQAVARLQAQAANGTISGSIFGSVFRRIKRIGSGLGSTISNLARLRIKKALQSAARTAMAAAPIAAIAVPGAAAALAVTPARLAAAQRFLSAAQRGAPRARATVHRLTARARAGDPRARQIALLLAQAARMMQQLQAVPGATAPAMAGATFGTWARASNGAEVFVPAAAGGVGLDYLLHQLRPHLGYRKDTADVLTRRKAYRSGLAAMADRHR